MRTLKLVPLFLLVLLGGQQFFFDNLVYARHTANHCCMCGVCKSYCWCPGQANCSTCHTDDGDTILSPVSTNNLSIDIRQTAQLRPQKVVMSDHVERVLALVHGSRLREHFTMKLNDHVADHMKFKCMNLDRGETDL